MVSEPPSSAARSARRLVGGFAGTPRAGKTSAIREIGERLIDRGSRVLLVDGEPAADRALPTRHPHFNLWAATATAARIIEAMHAEADVVLVDKGLFDALCWLDWHRSRGYLTPFDHQAIERFLRVAALRKLIDLVFVMTVTPAVAVERELASWPPGVQYPDPTVVNSETLGELNDSIAAVVKRHRRDFKLRHIDTSRMSRDQTLDAVAGVVDSLIPA